MVRSRTVSEEEEGYDGRMRKYEIRHIWHLGLCYGRTYGQKTRAKDSQKSCTTASRGINLFSNILHTHSTQTCYSGCNRYQAWSGLDYPAGKNQIQTAAASCFTCWIGCENFSCFSAGLVTLIKPTLPAKAAHCLGSHFCTTTSTTAQSCSLIVLDLQ